jgi:carbonic anhydrase/acetyltransferase-like protein (isoleucine patch superfamily)
MGSFCFIAESIYDFGDGDLVYAHQHNNPDGSIGGWVADTAYVAPTAYVGKDALVFEYARVLGNAMVLETAEVSGHAMVLEDTKIYGRVCGYAIVVAGSKVGMRTKLDKDLRLNDEGRWVADVTSIWY